MKTNFKLPVKIFAAWAVVLMLFASAAFSQKNNDDKIHLKIITNENGNVIEIDTVFDAKDKEAANVFMEKYNMKMESGGDDERQIYMYKFDNSVSDEMGSAENQKARSKVERELEQLRKETDSLAGKSFSFNFKMPDENELKALEENMRDLKFDFKFDMPEFPELPGLPALPEMQWSAEGMSPEEKAKFEEHMQKAREEMRKAFDMMKDSGKFKMQFYFDDKDKKDDGSFNMERNFSDDVAVIAREKGTSKNCTVTCKVDDDSKNKSCSKVMVICSGDNSNNDATGKNQAQPRNEKRVILVEKPKSAPASEKYLQPKEDDIQLNATAEKTAAISTNAFSGLNIFPNPTSSTVDLVFTAPGTETLNIRIMDAAGKEVVNESFENFSGEFSKQYNLSEYGKGIYLLMLKQGDKWAHKKIIVK